MTTTARPPRDNLVRAIMPGVEMRTAGDGAMPTMVGHFAVFNQWTQIDSAWEGTFMERIAPGAFRKTIAERGAQVRVTLNHGMDPQAGDKPLGPIEVLREDDQGVYYEVPLLDTSYNRDILPGLQAGLYGASFRFQVMKERMVDEPKASAYNPRALPERTIEEVQLHEFGPVTFPAYPEATAGVRSLTDYYVLDRLVKEPDKLRAAVDALPALSDGAEAPHSEPESREAAPPPAPPATVEPTKNTDPPKGGSSDSRDKKVDLSKFKSRQEMADRIDEITATINDLAEEFPASMPPERETEFNALCEERKALEPELAKAQLRAEAIRAKATEEKNVSPFPIPNIATKRDITYDPADIFNRGGTQEQRGQAFRDNAMRIVEDKRSMYPRHDVPREKQQAEIQRLLDEVDSPTRWNPDHLLARRIQALQNPAYIRSFDKFLRYGSEIGYTPEEQRAAALAVQVDDTGGHAVPVFMDPTILPTGSFTSVNPFRTPGLFRVEQIVGTDTWQNPTVGVIAATRADEAAAATEQGPTFDATEIQVTRVHVAVTYSIEAGQDVPNLMSALARGIAESKANEEELTFCLGDATAIGSKFEPVGIAPDGGAVAGQFSHVHMAAAHTYAIGDLDSMEAALPLRYRSNAIIGMGKKTIRTTQGLETTGGRLFGGVNFPQVGGLAGSPATGNTGKRLLEYPLYEFPSMRTDVLTDDYGLAVIFDPQRYVIVDRLGMTIELIPHMFADAAGSLPTGQRAVYAIWRNSAKPLNADAGRILYVLNA